MAPNVEVNLHGLLELDKSDLSGNKHRLQLGSSGAYWDSLQDITVGLSLGTTCRLRVLSRTMVLSRTYLQNSSGDSGPDLSFDKSTSPERLFSLALVSLAEISKPVLSFGCSGGDYTSSTAKAFFFKIAPEKELVSFINQLGCSKTIMSISALRINDMYQPWRTLLTMINKFLTGKATTHDRLRLFML
ncbi:hypothetical protein Tco_0648788 [Tanacetum coccineum]